MTRSSLADADVPRLYLGSMPMTYLNQLVLCHVWDDGTVLPLLEGFDSTRLLSPEETSARLGGIPIVRLDRWRKEGRIAYVKLTAKTIGYPEEGVEEFIQANLVPATREPTPTGLNRPKSEEHKRRIAEAQKAAWARRKKAAKS